MINPEELLEMLKSLKGTDSEVKAFINEAMHNFALTKDENFEGVYPLLIILYQKGLPILKESEDFLHDLRVLERQIMHYMAMLGSSIETAKSDVAAAIKDAEHII